MRLSSVRRPGRHGIETKDRLVVGFTGYVGYCPAIAFMDEFTGLVGMVSPEAAHPAIGAMRAPLLSFEMTFAIQRHDQLIAMPAATLGKSGIAGQLKANCFQQITPPSRSRAGTSACRRLLTASLWRTA